MSEQEPRTYKVGDEERQMPTQAKGIKQLLERVETEKQAKSSQQITLDNSNKVSFPDFPYVFEALGEHILVSIDVFKSGYECEVCKGEKIIHVKCACEVAGHAGLKYGTKEIETIKIDLRNEIANARAVIRCPVCNGKYESQRKDVPCFSCKGAGAKIIIPQESKNLPTTGVVVSIGKLVDRKNLDYKVGDRVLFSTFSGSMIPTKSGLMLKKMDANAPWARIEGGDDLNAFDFIINEEPE